MVNSKIQAGEENLLHVYNRFPIALDHGEGMYVYDTEGRKFWILPRDLPLQAWVTAIKN